MSLDTKSIERIRGSAVPHFQVSANQLYREWLDAVRGRCGALLHRVSWESTRLALLDGQLEAWYAADVKPEQAAAMIRDLWYAQHPSHPPLIEP